MGRKREDPAVCEQRKSLFLAAQTGLLDPVREWLPGNQGDSIEVRNLREGKVLVQPASSDTVLHVAARSGCLEAVRFFLEELHLDHLLTAANQDGKCALHEAAQSLHLGTAQYLIDRGTPVDVLKRADWTPLMLACTRDGSEDMVKLLLENGAKASLRNKDGWTPFHIATRKGHVPTLKVLLGHDSCLWDTTSKNGRNPLHTAAVHGHPEVLQLLLEHASTQVDSADSCGTTPIMDAARADSPACCAQLLEKGARVLEEDGVGRNAFHVAAQAGSTAALTYLLGAAADLRSVNCAVDVPTRSGQTALHLAAREGHTGTLRFLLANGANVRAKAHDGSTAYDIASRYQNTEALRVIEDHIAANLGNSR